MFNYIFYRAKNQWKILSLLWLSFLIANTFIISGPTYLGWVKGMIYKDALDQVPATTKNISITTGNQPLIKDSFEKNDTIINSLASTDLDDLFIDQSSVLQSTEYYWGKLEPDKSRTASLLTFVALSNSEKFINSANEEITQGNYINVLAPKKRLDDFGLKVGDILKADSIKGSAGNVDTGLKQTKENIKNFILQIEAEGGSTGDIFDSSASKLIGNVDISELKQGLSTFGVNNLEELNQFLNDDLDEVLISDLELRVSGYFNHIPNNELFGYYDELFLPPSPCMTCQLPLVLVMDKDDYFDFLQPLTKGLPVRAWWYLDIEHEKLTENIDNNYLQNLQNFEKNMLISFPQATVLTQLDRVTEKTDNEMNFVRAPVLMIFSLLVIFSSTLLAMFSFLINQERKEEINYLFLRGTSKFGVIKYFLFEWFIFGIPIMIVAPLLSNTVLNFVISSYLKQDPLGTNWLFIFKIESMIISIIFLLIACLFSFIIYLAFNNQLINSKKLFIIGTSVKNNIFTKYFLDIFIAAGSILIFFELRMRVLSSVAENLILNQYTFFLMSLVLMIFLTMVLIRILPILLKILSIIGVLAYTPLYLSSKKLSKNSNWYLWLFLIVALGMTSFIVISSIQSSLEKSKKDKSSFITISDFRISESSPFGIEEEYISDLKNQPGINVVGRMNRISGNSGTTGAGTNAQLLGVDKSLVDIAWTREDFFYESKEQLFSEWENNAYNPGIIIQDNISFISIKNYSDKDLEDSFLWAIIKGSDSRITAVSLGPIESDKWTTNSVKLKNIKYPARLIGVEVYEPSSEDNSVPFTLYLDSIAFLDNNSEIVKQISFTDNFNWAPMPTSEGFDTSIESNNESLIIKLGNGSTKGIRGIYVSDYSEGIPVIASDQFIAKSGKSIGDQIIFNATGSYIPMKIIKSAKYFPGTSNNNDFILVDLKILKNYLELTKLQIFRPNELVVDVQNGYQETISEYVIENFPLSSIKDKSMIEEKSLVTPIAVISWKGISIVGLWAFMSLMFIGLIGFYIANEIQSSFDNAINEAIGFAPFSKFVMSYFEYGAVILYGVISGVISGLIISRILNQLVMSLDESTLTNFPDTLIISWGYVIYALLLLGLLYASCSFIFSFISTRTNIAEELKKVN